MQRARGKWRLWWLVSAAALAVVPLAGAQDASLKLRTQPLQYTGVAGTEQVAGAGVMPLRTKPLQFSGVAGLK